MYSLSCSNTWFRVRLNESCLNTCLGIEGRIKVSEVTKFISTNVLHDRRICRSESHLSFGEESIEVFGVSSILYYRNKGRLNFPILNLLPVNSPEEGMIHDVNFFRRSWTKSFVRSLYQQSSTDFLRFLWHKLGIWNGLLSNGGKQLFFIFSIKGRLSN